MHHFFSRLCNRNSPAVLAGGARVAGDAVEGGSGGAALAETTTERGEAEAEARGDRDEAVVRGKAALLDRRATLALGEGNGREAEDEEERNERNDPPSILPVSRPAP